jgi:hypothetical protein
MGMRHVMMGVCLLLPLAGASWGDTLTVGTTRHTGTFVRFEDNCFVFSTADGRALSPTRTSVRRLDLQPPREVLLRRSGKPDAETVVLDSYAGGKFMVRDRDLKTGVPALFVEAVTVKASSHRGERKGRRSELPIDVDRLAARPGLTAQQSAALERYRAARGQYDAFLARSSAMVAEMDAATGVQRERLLDALRRRKAEEQPIAVELTAARAQVLAVFPDHANEPAPVPANTAASLPDIVFYVPDAGDNEVLVLDTRVLTEGVQISDEQERAVRRYNEAVERYRESAAAAVDGDESNGTAEVGLLDAQQELLKAFPSVKLVVGE